MVPRRLNNPGPVATGAIPSAARDGVTVVLPTYNEARCVEEIVRRVAASLIEFSIPAEVVVVDDDSPDGTAEIARRMALELPVSLRVLERSGPRSLSHSVIDGAQRARYACVAVLDADLSHDPRDLPRLVEPVLSGEVDLSIGSRYASGGVISRWPLHRRIVSGLGTRLARALTRTRDPLSGFFAARKALFDGSVSALHPRGYKILLEILGRTRGLRVCEVPVRFQDRHAGKSKLGTRQVLEFLRQFLSLLLSQLTATPKRRAHCAPVEEEGFLRANDRTQTSFLETLP
jgi:dolichol-phosphate mannosyltransferase